MELPADRGQENCKVTGTEGDGGDCRQELPEDWDSRHFFRSFQPLQFNGGIKVLLAMSKSLCG